MKKIFTYLLALATVTTVVSCDDNDDPEPIVEPVAGPTITWESHQDFDTLDITDKMDVKIQVDAPAGIKTFKIAVKSEVLNDMGITAIDLIEPGEKVKQYVDMILGGAGSPKDKTSYLLDLSKFVPMINDLTNEESDHSFTLTVADKNDSTAMWTAVFHQMSKNFTETAVPVTFDMVYVKGGKFLMGAREEDREAYDNEKPAHEVTLTKDYYIGKFVVTQELWTAVMGTNPSKFQVGVENPAKHPVENVSWNDVQDFLTKLSDLTGKKYVLPTEAQWEYAARGGAKSKGYKYSGSNIVDSVAWCKKNAKTTMPVGQKQPNELGLYDMSGNVFEFCSDLFGLYDATAQPEIDPQGNVNGVNRVARGGSWGGVTDAYCRVSNRAGLKPTKCDSNYGFRLALVLD